MKRIILDFKNRWVVIDTDEQYTSEDMWSVIQKASMKDFLPKDKTVYMRGDNFTLDFDNNKIWLNESFDYIGNIEYPEPIPLEAYDFENLDMLFDDVLDRMGYAIVSKTTEEYSDYMDTISFFTGK